jgi:hypothetical protein
VPPEWSNFALLLGLSGVASWVTNPLKNICEKLTHVHKMLYTWWCWHICKGEVGVELDQLGEEKKVFWCTLNYRMVLGLEFCIYSLCFGSNMQVGCVALWISFSKCPRSLKSEFEAKSYNHFSVERSVTGCWTEAQVQSPVSTSESNHRVQSLFVWGLFWGCNWTLTLGCDRTHPCHCSRPKNAEGKQLATAASPISDDRTCPFNENRL